MFNGLDVRLFHNQGVGINIVPSRNFLGQIRVRKLFLKDCGNRFDRHFFHGLCGGTNFPAETLGLQKLISFLSKDDGIVWIRRKDEVAASVLRKGEYVVERCGVVNVDGGSGVGFHSQLWRVIRRESSVQNFIDGSQGFYVRKGYPIPWLEGSGGQVVQGFHPRRGNGFKDILDEFSFPYGELVTGTKDGLV